MKKASFLNQEKPLIAAMIKYIQTPESCISEAERAIAAGAEAFGFQCENLPEKYHNAEDFERIFNGMGGLPIYVTSYKLNFNIDKSYDSLADELLLCLDCGATLIDVMGDIYCKADDELTFDPLAMKKQKTLIDRIHEKGGEVLMSSHINRFTSAERVLEIAMEHQRRGADISKIVVHSNTMEEQMENLRITALLKERLDIPFLFLVGGDCCRIHRRIGILAGNCMSLCMCEVPANNPTPTQPLISEQLMFRDQLNLTERKEI